MPYNPSELPCGNPPPVAVPEILSSHTLTEFRPLPLLFARCIRHRRRSQTSPLTQGRHWCELSLERFCVIQHKSTPLYARTVTQSGSDFLHIHRERGKRFFRKAGKFPHIFREKRRTIQRNGAITKSKRNIQQKREKSFEIVAFFVQSGIMKPLVTELRKGGRQRKWSKTCTMP